MRIERFGLIFAVLFGTGVVAGAAPIAAAGAPAASDSEVADGLRTAIVSAKGGDCTGALATLDPLLPRVTAPSARRAVQLARVTCLGAVGRTADLQAAYSDVAATDPNDPVVRNLGILIAADMGDFPLAGERLAAFAEQRPADVALVSGENWQMISQGLVRAKKRDLRRRVSVALARAGWRPEDRPEIAEAVASDAIEALLADHAVQEARAMLVRVAAPELLFSMAIERNYQPVWKDIEGAMGPNGATSVDRFAADKIEANANNPADPLALRDAVRSYLLLGRPADAAGLAAQVPVADGMSEETVTVVGYHAQALAAEGKSELAISRLKPLVALDLSKTPAAASGAIALAELYHDAGKPEDELALARDMLGRKDDVFSAWGRGWLQRNEVCALSDLHRAEEARTAVASLVAQATSNQAAAIEGLLCAGRDDEAAKLAVATLALPEGASLIADQFQPTEALWSVPTSRLRALWSGLLARSDVKVAFDRVARILPRALWPARSPRPIPRAPDAAPLAETV
jgi:hypothetical protein